LCRGNSGAAGPVDLEALVTLALEHGASGAAPVDPARIVVEDELAERCLEPRCKNYGVSASCPPHVGGPVEIRKLLTKTVQALVIKIDLPSEIYFSSDRIEIDRLLHEIVAAVERTAREMSASWALGLAGGSCKKLFCREERDCNVVDHQGPCRHPDKARPSMSGYGINVNKLAESAGWPMWLAKEEVSVGQDSMATLTGLVLIG
jgi:predicted metal-binding protein